jgi:hypothetical protein
MICTLWLADWFLERGRWPEDLERAQDLLLWVVDRALPSGVLPEQLHPLTGAPLSISPLTWSHAEFVGTVHRFLDCLGRLQVGKSGARPAAARESSRTVVASNGASVAAERAPSTAAAREMLDTVPEPLPARRSASADETDAPHNTDR